LSVVDSSVLACLGYSLDALSYGLGYFVSEDSLEYLVACLVEEVINASAGAELAMVGGSG
jgi:hypothetical protein